MDDSKLPGFTKKSSETPWTPTHERKKLSDRAGTVTRSRGALNTSRNVKQWHPNAKKKFLGIPLTGPPHYKKVAGGVSTNVTQGKEPKSGRPIKKSHGGLGIGLKDKKDESEY